MTPRSCLKHLRDVVNCEVYFDEWALSTTFGEPAAAQLETEWVLNCAAKCDFFLILFSAASKVLLEKSVYLIKKEGWK